MTTYSYHGPIQSLSLRIGKERTQDIQLIPGRPVPKLPMDHPVITSLFAANMLRAAGVNKAGDKPTKGNDLPKGDEPSKGVKS